MSNQNNHSEELFHYEGDQSKLYSGLYNYHTDVKSEESKKQVKRIWKITGILSIITAVEVAIGLFIANNNVIGTPKFISNIIFILLTVLKAGYIVSVFMHLGDEKRNMRIAILLPLILFIWFIIAFLYEGGAWLEMNRLFLGK